MSKAEQIKIGDIVTLKSGGPDMRVIDIGFGVLRCEYWPGYGVQWAYYDFSVQCVVKLPYGMH